MSRYSRHTVLSEIGEEGQKKLSESTVAIVGLGGLGSIMADALVRCGVGKVKIVDRDFVEISNLQRQTLYDEDDIGVPKTEVAEKRLKNINSEIEIISKSANIGPGNIEEYIRGTDIVLDGTDNLKTRYVINDACVKHDIPWIYSAVLRTYGMTMNIIPGETPCLRCMIPDKADEGTLETCATAGILFSLPRTMANIASTEAVKYLVRSGMRKGLLTVDLWRDEYEITEVQRNEDCTCCGNGVYDFLNMDEDEYTELCGTETVQVLPKGDIEIDLDKIISRYERAEKIGESMIKIPLEKYELNLFKDGRMIVKGTKDVDKAESLYSEYVGR